MSETTCPVCSGPVPLRTRQPGRPRRFCSKRCQKKFGRFSRTRICEEIECGRPVLALGWCAYHYREASGGSRGRRETKRQNDRIKTQRRRAAEWSAESERVDRQVVGGRDGWICQLCLFPIDQALTWPDPASASLDHIEPLSLGGPHTYTNTQISHLGCNMAKSNKVA